MAITSAGYDGSVDEAAFSRMLAEGGSPYGPFCNLTTGDPDYFAGLVTAKSGGTREVNVAPFAATGYGVRVTSDSIVTKQSDVVASGTRWDLICVRRDWSGTGGTSTIEIVKGNSTQQIPPGANRVNAAGAGVDDEPIALVQYTAGQTAPTALLDLRQWPSKVPLVGSLLAVRKTFGAMASLGGVLYKCDLVSGSLQWLRFGSSQSRYSDYRTNVATNASGDFTITLPPGTITGSVALVEFSHIKFEGFPQAFGPIGFTWSHEKTTLTALTGRIFYNGQPYAGALPTIGFTVTTNV